ncbi:MAG: trypsin-like serine protease, partial [Desulfobacteraceae bacterium]|nr:trypsin-like serine protease [Desulfobacteraceae bacterium]
MKRCTSCGQIVAQSIRTCPACGSHIVAGMKFIDDYRILNIIHEGRSSLVCKAVKEDGTKPVTIRLFTDQSGVTEDTAQRLETELKELAKLPPNLFVQHFAIKKSSSGHWYRVSEWVDADNWGTIFVSGTLKDQRRMVTLFYNIASALEILHTHDHFMPYLILEDILIPKDQTRGLGVKINYKLSRFLDARATHHGPMLQKLLASHPDIVNERAIDFRTGIWSLGKIFIELLTADHNLIDFSAKVDQLKGLDPELGVLIKVMLSDDPDLRPKTMGQIASALSIILNQMPHKSIFPSAFKQKPKLLKELNWFKRMVVVLLFLIVGIVAANTFSWFYMDSRKGKEEIGFSGFIESYADSIGFIMVEYWLVDSTRVVYRNKVEGTAFLVDNQGYMLTNRHVACPWLEDPTLFQIYNQYKHINIKLDFNHRMFLWFEGEKAFNRLPSLKDSHELADSYYLASAFQSQGKNNLRIVGVPRASGKIGEMINSPFKHDFAVLKIDAVPKNLTPLPLETNLDATHIQRLSPVIILGFPLGNRTQDDHINASITRGHVRRSTKEIIQVDSSIYKGNSGGPAVNANGHVIGIASGVITNQPTRYLPVNTPLSDFGLILPISRPAQFIKDLKAGQPKWDGKLDFTLDTKLKLITDLALEHKYGQAAKLTDTMLETSKEPILFFTAAILHFCSNNLDKSRNLFSQLISIDTGNTTSKLMLHIIDWIRDQDQSHALTKDLFTMNWQHPDEFSGYLAMVLAKGLKINQGFIDFENNSEKTWRLFIQSLLMEKENQMGMAMKGYKETILTAGANDYIYFLAFARLDELLEKHGAFVDNKEKHQAQIMAFRNKAEESREKAKERYTAASALVNKFESSKTSHEEKIKTYKALLELLPGNRTIIGRVAFFHAMNSEWEKALTFIDSFLSKPSRETALSLSLGLLKGEILNITTSPGEATTHLINFQSQIQDPWYGIISKHLAQGTPRDNLVKLAG